MAKAHVEAQEDIDPSLVAVIGTYPNIDIEYPLPEDFENGRDGAWL